MNHAQKNFSTQPPAPRQNARLPAPDADPIRTRGAGPPSQQGTAAPERQARLPRLNSASLPAAFRLHRRAEFTAVYRRGKRLALPHFQLIALPPAAAPASPPRFGITVPRQAGTAVLRNRLRRRTRALLAQLAAGVPAGWQVVVHPRPAVAGEAFARLRNELQEGLLRLAPPAKPPAGALR